MSTIDLTGGSVLVCGAGGFIGGHMVAALRRRGVELIRAVDIKPLSEWYQRFDGVESVVMDLRDRRSCQVAVESIDHVINLAADMGGMGFIATHKAECMLNVLINTQLLVAARDKGVRSYYFASSACVYNQELQSNTEIIRLQESDAWPALPEEGYGLEKLFAEEMCRLFRRDFGVPASYARYHNVYGPHGAYEGGREKAPAALCRKVAAARLFNEKAIEIWGDGEQRRTFLYIDDCIQATIKFIESGKPGPLNIGSEESVSINELLGIIEEIAGIRCERTYKDDSPQGVRGRCSDNTLIAKELDWKPSVPLRQGLQQTYKWIFDELAQQRVPAQ